MSSLATGSGGSDPQKPRILCVDDEPLLLDGLVKSLRRRFQVSTATSGEDGVRVISEATEPFSVILSDLRMPGMNGAEFLARARALMPDATRILLTGHATVEGAADAVNQGLIFKFLLKPCPTDELVQAVEEGAQQSRRFSADRELVNAKLVEVKTQLLEAERLATLGTLAGAVGHELRNNLVILGDAIHVLEAAEDPGYVQESIELLRRAREHVTAHARSLLDLGRPDPDAAQVVDLCRTAADTVGTLRAAGVLRRIPIDVHLPATPVLVRLARVRIEQVLVNLLKNAADALEDARRVDPRVRLDVEVDGASGQVVCRVSDNGAGITEEHQQRLFTPYFTTKAAGRGTGLGLFVVKQVVESVGGSVQLDSVAGAGTTVTIRIPVVQEVQA